MLTESSKRYVLFIILLGIIAPITILGFIGLNDSDTSTVPDEVLSASEEIMINGRVFNLETYIWRDFMPLSPPGGKPMIIIIRIIPNDSQAFPSDLDTNRLWLINGDDIVSLTFTNETRIKPPNILEKVAREGPKWDVGIKIDVVIRLIQNGYRTYYLKAKDQIIHSTF